jgi:3-oxoacyl-[acyl-carrier protein] reductase
MKNIILTGASRGIGKSLFENLKKNYNVIGLSKNPQDKDKEIIQCDISKEEEVDKVFDQIKKKYKSIYSLINCAGILSTGQLINTDTLNLNKMIDVNFKGTIFCSKKALKLMLKEGKGRIINFSSIASFFPLKGDSVYSATKGAVNIFTKSLAKEVEKKNITVNAIAPGFVLTDMTSTLSEEQKKKLIELQTIKREITFDDILNIVIFLLSETGKSTTGQVIQVG